MGEVEIPPFLRDFQARGKALLLDFSTRRRLPPPSSPTNSAIEPDFIYNCIFTVPELRVVAKRADSED